MYVCSAGAFQEVEEDNVLGTKIIGSGNHYAFFCQQLRRKRSRFDCYTSKVYI